MASPLSTTSFVLSEGEGDTSATQQSTPSPAPLHNTNVPNTSTSKSKMAALVQSMSNVANVIHDKIRGYGNAAVQPNTPSNSSSTPPAPHSSTSLQSSVDANPGQEPCIMSSTPTISTPVSSRSPDLVLPSATPIIQKPAPLKLNSSASIARPYISQPMPNSAEFDPLPSSRVTPAPRLSDAQASKPFNGVAIRRNASTFPSHSVTASTSTAHNSIALDVSHVHGGTEPEKDRRPSKRGRSPINDGDDQDDVKPPKRQKSNTAPQAPCCAGIKPEGLSTHRKSDIHRDRLPSEEQNKLEWWVCPNFGSCPTRQMHGRQSETRKHLGQAANSGCRAVAPNRPVLVTGLPLFLVLPNNDGTVYFLPTDTIPPQYRGNLHWLTRKVKDQIKNLEVNTPGLTKYKSQPKTILDTYPSHPPVTSSSSQSSETMSITDHIPSATPVYWGPPGASQATPVATTATATDTPSSPTNDERSTLPCSHTAPPQSSTSRYLSSTSTSTDAPASTTPSSSLPAASSHVPITSSPDISVVPRPISGPSAARSMTDSSASRTASLSSATPMRSPQAPANPPPPAPLPRMAVQSHLLSSTPAPPSNMPGNLVESVVPNASSSVFTGASASRHAVDSRMAPYAQLDANTRQAIARNMSESDRVIDEIQRLNSGRPIDLTHYRLKYSRPSFGIPPSYTTRSFASRSGRSDSSSMSS
ncbi:uncharacterized protein STEHIDRAFT_155152 [Stereum hirsutum FP-91666 SS1]|uniref:uncharacterized protein n=1 Tax=Stereum hirsutum (strain FP-91666) TaxID=721885 RepID=UPI000440EBE3|nr:uncharacterized protein STEHIDRAFT_155152 [Stereum hirsutum FP-91666 SS1]EIM87780.1 hypothetical protein STEHIDRAFT_155152 [Stereum hirsutum FP-91666 SS1]